MADDRSLKWIFISAALGAGATLVVKDVLPATFDYMWNAVTQGEHLTVDVVRKDNRKPIEGANVSLLDKQAATIIDSKLTNAAGTVVFFSLKKDTYIISTTFGAGISRTDDTKPFNYEGGRKIQTVEMELMTSIARSEAVRGSSIQISTNVADSGRKLRQMLDIALAEKGQTELVNGRPNSKVLEYMATVEGLPQDVSFPWNSQFANWVVKKAGLPGTNSGASRSWLSWGKSISEPVPGAIAVFWQISEASGSGSVGFVTRADENNIFVVGGNFNNSVREAARPRSQLLGIRVP